MDRADISAKVAGIVDLVILRTPTLHALHSTVHADDTEIARLWKRPDASEWRDLITHAQFGPIGQWLWDVEGRSCELKYELVAAFSGDWDEFNDLLFAEVSRRRMR